MNAIETFLPSDEDRIMLRDAVRGGLERVWPALCYAESSADPARLQAAWASLCEQGLASLGSDRSEGGLREIAIVMEELGRAACLAPLLPAAIANLLLWPRRTETPELGALLGDVQEGRAALALSFGDCDPGGDVGAISVRDGKVSGDARFVEAAEISTHFLVFSKAHGLAIVARDARTVTLESTRAMGAPGLSRVAFDGAPAQLVAVDEGRIADMLQISRVGLSARSYGETSRAFELVTDYVKERKQFGRLVGSFQAIQHKLANELIVLDGCRLIIAKAAESYDQGEVDWRIFAATAFATAAASLRQVAFETHHAFGAIGYAEEHEAPRHTKRVHVDMVRHGGWRAARAELADRYLGETAAPFPEIDLGPDGNAFRAEVRAWMDKAWPPERDEVFRDRPYHEREYDPEFAAKIGETGWLGLTWPKVFGGQARNPLEQVAFLEVMEQYEAPRAGAPIQAPMLMKYGTPEQQARYLPEMLAGQVYYGMGYSEPNSGSDLASLQTRATRDGDEWVINGQKIWCTSYRGHYLLVAARTDPAATPPSAGISAFIVPTATPGLTFKPSATMYDGVFANIFFDDVRVPADALVGEVNGGWKVLIGAMAYERSFIGGTIILQMMRLFDLLCGHLRTTEGPRGSLRLDPLIRDKIGELAAELEVGRQMMVGCANIVASGNAPLHEAAISKVYSGELMARFGEAALDMLGLPATLSHQAPGAILRGRLEQKLRHSLMWVISLGTNEIQRNLIASRGLGLPQ